MTLAKKLDNLLKIQKILKALARVFENIFGIIKLKKKKNYSDIRLRKLFEIQTGNTE